MPLVPRAERDILRLKPVVNAIVNPTNTRGAMGAGLALALREAFPPAYYEDFVKACKDEKVKIGKLHTWTDPANGFILINLPTKDHFADPSKIEYVKRGLRSLRTYLSERPLMSIVMPMLGCGLGQLDEKEVEALNYEYLDDLPNIIHVSRWPSAFPDGPPKYLGVIGSRILKDSAYVEECVTAALVKWGLKPEDFAACVSGGADGVDTIACGKSMADESYKDSLAVRLKMRPIIVQADWKKYGRTAGFKRNHALVDIVTHCVAILDERESPSVGTRQALTLVKAWNKSNPDAQITAVAYSYKGPKADG